MHIQSFTFSLSSIPPVFKRDRHALILVRNSKGNFILGSKHHYPEGIARMVGGGLQEYEDPQEGAARELQEETGLQVTAQDLVPLITIAADISDPQERQWHFLTFIFFYDSGDKKLTPSDDLDGIVELSKNDYKKLVNRFKNLSRDMHPEMKFRWSDYGVLYGTFHAIALEELEKLGL